MTTTTYKKGNWYRFIDECNKEHTGQYMGRVKGFECCVCNKGCYAHCFNIWYDEDGGYETWGYGNEHLPKMIENLGKSEEIILDK